MQIVRSIDNETLKALVNRADASKQRSRSGLVRVLMHIARNPGTTTGIIRHECNYGNVSEASRVINSRLAGTGYLISCECSSTMHTDRFGSAKHQFQWSLYREDRPGAVA